MERGINTRCLHLEETEGKTDNYGALSYPDLSDSDLRPCRCRKKHRIRLQQTSESDKRAA